MWIIYKQKCHLTNENESHKEKLTINKNVLDHTADLCDIEYYNMELILFLTINVKTILKILS